MTPLPIRVDFVEQRKQSSPIGVLLLVAGLAMAGWSYFDYQDVTIDAELLEMQLARRERVRTRSAESVPVVDPDEVRQAREQLATPWSVLLHDLELAAKDSGSEVALLEVAPDKNKRSVLLSGEARSLTHALDYVRRLQSTDSLLSPLLMNHEVIIADRERPVHFVVRAEWRISR